MDINRLNGLPVGVQGEHGVRVRNTDPGAMAAVSALQAALLRQPGVREDFGPDYLLKMPGRQTVTSAYLVNMHQKATRGLRP